jgi:hypothetical protein
VVAVEVPRPTEDDSSADLVLTVIIKDVPGLSDDDTDDASPFSNTDDAASADNLQVRSIYINTPLLSPVVAPI